MTPQHFLAQQRAASRAGTSTTASTGWRTIPTSPSTSSATSSPSRIRPSRSRTASAGPTRPTDRCWSRRWRRAPSRRRSTSARRCTARSAVRCWSSTATTTRSSPMRAASCVAELSGGELVTIEGGGHNPLGRYPAKCNALINDFLDRRLGHCRAQAGGRAAAAGAREEGALSLVADRPRPRPPRHRHRARTAQAASRPAGRLAGAGPGDAPARGQRRARPSAQRAAGQRIAAHRARIRRARSPCLPGDPPHGRGADRELHDLPGRRRRGRLRPRDRRRGLGHRPLLARASRAEEGEARLVHRLRRLRADAVRRRARGVPRRPTTTPR